MADIKNAYGTKTTITITGTSLANGSARESTVIDNTTNKFTDARVRVALNGQTSGSAQVDFYVYSALGDTGYTDGATGSDAAFTAANRLNARYVGSIQMNVTTAVKGELPSIAAAFGGVMPDKWGLIMVNNSGAALSATAGDTVIEFEGIYQTVT